MDLSVIGIIVSLAVIVVLALRGLGIAVIGPLAAALVAVFSGMGVFDTLMGPYMKGFISYASKFFLIFLFASIFGKYMEDSGAAKAIAGKLLSLVGHKGPFYVLFSVAVITLLLTLGGVSMFVVIFTVMPIARPLFKQMNIPWHLFIAAFIFGIGSLSMTMVPGSPSIQNIMPTRNNAVGSSNLGDCLFDTDYGLECVVYALAIKKGACQGRRLCGFSAKQCKRRNSGY